MYLAIIVNFVLLFHLSNSTSKDCERDGFSLSDEKRLITSLLNSYKKAGIVGRPVKDSFQTVVVYYSLELIQILDLDEKNQVLTINVWARYKWIDELLKWNPRNYSNVTTVRVPSNEIWTPDIVLYNYADERLKEHRNVMIVVDSSGETLWIPPAIFKSSCKIDIKNFPFDQQGCHLKFGSWTYDGSQLDIQFINNQSEVSLEVYTPSNEWAIIARPGIRNEKYYPCCDEPYPDITFFLFLKRNPAFYTYLLILPCVLLSCLTLVIFWLPPESPAKMVLGMNIFVAFFLLLLLLADSTPSASQSVPYIGFYYCLNMILITMSTFCSVMVINLYFRGDNKKRVPSWLKKVIVKVGFVLFMDTSNIVTTNEKIKIIQSEIKYNRKFCKKVGFKFGSTQNIKEFDSNLNPDNNNHQITRNNMMNSLNVASSSGEMNSKFLNCPMKENNTSRNQMNYSPANKIHNSLTIDNNKVGSIKYCLEKNKIIITQDENHELNPRNQIIYDNSSNITPQLERTILKFSQTLESDVSEIRKSIRILMNRMADIDNANKRASEWRTVALVLDRIFFLIFLSTIIVSALVLLLPKSPSNTIEEIIKQNTPLSAPKNKTQ